MSTLNFSIRVMRDDDERPYNYCQVTVGWGLLTGHSKERTDEDGWAEFNDVPDRGGRGKEGRLYIDGYDLGKHHFNEGDTVSFSVTPKTHLF